MTPETTAGKALLGLLAPIRTLSTGAENEKEWAFREGQAVAIVAIEVEARRQAVAASEALARGADVAAIAEARRTVLAELRAEVGEHIPYDGQDQSDSCWIYCACGWNANDDAKDSWTDHIDAAIARRLGEGASDLAR